MIALSSKITTREIVLTALFAALACVATMVIRIPTPATSGYIHPGDAIVILCGLILGPRYGFLAAGLGSWRRRPLWRLLPLCACHLPHKRHHRLSDSKGWPNVSLIPQKATSWALSPAAH